MWKQSLGRVFEIKQIALHNKAWNIPSALDSICIDRSFAVILLISIKIDQSAGDFPNIEE